MADTVTFRAKDKEVTVDAEAFHIHMSGNERRRHVCNELLSYLPDLKGAVRDYMSAGSVSEKDFAAACKIWRALDGVEDAAEKLSQSELEE